MVEFIKDAQFKFSHAKNSNIWPWSFKQKSNDPSNKIVDLSLVDMVMSVSESDSMRDGWTDKNEFFNCFVYLQRENERLRVKMQALLCSLMWVDIVLHVKLGMILLQIIVIRDNMDVLLTRVFRIVKTGLGRYVLVVAGSVVKLV